MLRPSRLGTRLVLAFSLVSLVAVGLVAGAARIGVDRGLSAATSDDLAETAGLGADLAARAFQAAGGWTGADLSASLAAARDRDATLEVLAADGARVVGDVSTGSGPRLTAPVRVAGTPVGSVVVRSAGPGGAMGAADRGRELAWSWILGSAILALLLAVAAGAVVTRWLIGPLARLTEVARSVARGDLSARVLPRGADELGDLARGFNDAADAVERSTVARRRMAADVAHELRTPLAALQAGLEELRDGLAPAEPETLGRLHDQAVRLGRVIGDLGILAAVDDDAPRPVPGRSDLATVVRSEAAARAPELRAAGVEMRVLELPPAAVLADPDRLHQVVGNLLANCARHCRRGDHVEVRITLDRDHAALEVADDGPGIAPADLAHVTERYRRGSATRTPGSGLGLAVVREIVESYGGDLEVASVAGTQVTVRLPRG